MTGNDLTTDIYVRPTLNTFLLADSALLYRLSGLALSLADDSFNVLHAT